MRCLFFIVLLWGWLAQACADPYYCPSRQGYVRVGDTYAQVVNKCGEPTAQQTKRVVASEEVPVQRYTFRAVQENDLGFGFASGRIRLAEPIIVSVYNNKVVQISANNQPLQSTNYCGGMPIRVGDSIFTVQAACGEPRSVTEGTVKRNRGMAMQRTATYNFGRFQPGYVMVFQNDILVSIQSTQ